MDAKQIACALIVAGSVGLSFPALVWSQERVGVVTNVEGTATVARLTTGGAAASPVQGRRLPP
jgi:hypothetical protein